jgi:hypothetical protein
MSGRVIYEPSRRKRLRSTKAEVAARRAALFEIVAAGRPMTVRQAFYQATVRGLVEKTEAAYDRVGRDLTAMRRAGELPYEWLTDATRWQRKPQTFDSVAEALEDCAQFYRKDLWRDAGAYVEVWLEKDALAGAVYPVTAEYDVGLMVARGYASLSFLHGAAEEISGLTVPAHIYHLGDFDPSGINAGEKIEETLRELAPGADIYFERLAVTEEQISEWDLPSRPTKQTDSRAKNFGPVSVELDAVPPDTLRERVRAAIERHLPPAQFAALKVAEAKERAAIAAFVRQGDAP